VTTIQSKSKKIIIILLLIASIVTGFIPGLTWHYIAPVLTIITLLTFISMYKKKSIPADTPVNRVTEIALPRIVEKQAVEDTAQLLITSLGSAYRKQARQSNEIVIDAILDNGIKLIRSEFNCHTVAFFFPTLDGGYKLRKMSSSSDFINADAIIQPGVGVLGSFLKDGMKQLNLPEITNDSSTLYYYTKDTGVRSLMASLITAGNADRGIIVVDSTTKSNFTDEDHAFLNVLASIIGQAVFNTYLYTEHKLIHGRLAAMSSIEKEFFKNLNLESILDTMIGVIPFAIACDRITISVKNSEGNEAVIKRSYGVDSSWFTNKKFSIKDKSLAGILFSKNLMLSRDFSRDHYETRYCDDEPINEEFRSFIAVPVGVDDCKAMILIESFKQDAFSESCKELLTRLSISAGLAIEKIIVLDKARTLATRDGLTGLRNHREFQQILKDEITRAIRYNDPLALVLCDIDFFKKLNDTWGHQFGDLVLKCISSHLEGCIRDSVDTAARYGGEEFALILVKTDEKNAAETTERIRAHIAGLVFRTPGGEDIHVTMSFGIAVYRQHAKQLDELIKKADKALYRAKDNGRNRVEVF
jgi:diguanylate cyclase (GGDEF)-like protein